MNRRTAVMLAAWCFALGTPLDTLAQDSLAAARDLYASAAYEDALSVLDRLPPPRSVEDARAISEYRAFCLLALGRTTDAEHAIAALVAEQPMFEPAAADMSPRLRATFSEVRRRTLPVIIQQRYADAKAAYDRKEFAAASQGFQQVLTMLSEPSLAPVVGQPPLSDIRTLATGFKDLAVAATPPPPLPAVATPKAPDPEPVRPPAPSAPASKPVAAAPRVYASTDTGVVPPATIRQELPAFPGQVMIPKQGVIEILIDETGSVESAAMRVSVSTAYDALALAAAKSWRYRPALVNGLPVKYRKAVQITIKPTARL